MKFNRVFFSVKSVIIFFVLTHVEETKAIKEFTRFQVVNNILEDLKLELWSPEESSCVDATESILYGVRNKTLWATWVWDSMQLPVGTYYGSLFHLGNFDQCLQVPWSLEPDLQTQYCLVDVKLTALNQYDGEMVNPYDDADRYIGAKFRYGKRLTTIFLGVCLPSSCKPESVAKITRVMFRQTHLPLEEVTVDPQDCQVNDTLDKPLGYYIFWFIIIAMVSIGALVYFLPNTEEKSESLVSKVRRCFYLARNVDSLMEVRGDEIRSLNGIRALTCGIIVLGHYFFMMQFVALINKADAEKELTRDSFVKTLIHLDITVDTFLVMSGLLYTRGLMTSKSYQPFKTLLKRYFRLLVPLYTLSIVCITYVLPYIGSGPAWPRLVREVYQPCTRSWWRNLLMITNKMDDGTFCSVTSWNIHCDFQLTILATVIFVISRMRMRIGFILSVLVYGISLVIYIIWSYKDDLPGLLLYDFGPESQNMIYNKVYNTVYTSVFTKGSAYFIGMTMGYFMSVYKPQNYRRTISKSISIIGFTTGISFIFLVLLMGIKLFKKEYSPLWMAFFSSFDKSIWSAGICIIIIVCEYGTLPLLNDFLSSKAFVPLSKLTYCIYLFHTIFILRNIFSLRTPATYDLTLITMHGLGYLVTVVFVSYLLWMFVEAPVTNLINLMFNFKRSADKPKSDLQLGSNSKTNKKFEKAI